MALVLSILTVAAVAAALHGEPYGTTDDFLYERYIQAPLEDFTGPFGWKDEKAAELTHRSRDQYVIGGIEKPFRDNLAAMIHALDAAGYRTCINSGYRGPERQRLITAGLRAPANSSYHGGGPYNQGYGNGVAADLVSCFGTTQDERDTFNKSIYQWIDANGAAFDIGRPYGDHDAGHVGPRDGAEYATRHSEGHRAFAKYLHGRHHGVQLALHQHHKHRGRHYALR